MRALGVKLTALPIHPPETAARPGARNAG